MSAASSPSHFTRIDIPLDSHPSFEKFATEKPTLYEALAICKTLEEKLPEDQRVIARFLGFLILEAPSDDGAQFVAQLISDSKHSEGDLMVLGKMFKFHLGGLFHKHRPSWHICSEEIGPIPVSLQNIFNEIGGELQACEDSSHRPAALERSKGFCMISKAYDRSYSDSLKNQALRREYAESSVGSTVVEVCHIFPRTLNTNLEECKVERGGLRKKLKFSSLTWSLVNKYSGIDVLKGLNGNHIHDLKNLITLSSELHDAFDKQTLWFERIEGDDNKNTHNVVRTQPGYKIEKVFLEAGPDWPRQEFLELHAKLSRAYQMSGMKFGTAERHNDELYILPPPEYNYDWTPHARLQGVFSPLPENPFKKEEMDEKAMYEAYERCKTLEPRFMSGRRTAETRKKAVWCKFLGHLILNGKKDRSGRLISEDINREKTDEDFLKLAGFLSHHLGGLFKKYKGSVYSTKKYPTTKDYETNAQTMNGVLSECKKGKSEKIRQNTFERDGNMCVVTKFYDADNLESMTDDLRQAWISSGYPASACEHCHIFPRSLMTGVGTPTESRELKNREKNLKSKPPSKRPKKKSKSLTKDQKKKDIDDSQERKRNYVTVALMLVKRFGDINQSLLNKDAIDGLHNCLTLSKPVHDAFDTLSMWLEPDNHEESQNSYRVVSTHKIQFAHRSVKFSATNQEINPKKQLIGIHAWVARSYQMSGLGMIGMVCKGFYDGEHDPHVEVGEQPPDASSNPVSTPRPVRTPPRLTRAQGRQADAVA